MDLSGFSLEARGRLEKFLASRDVISYLDAVSTFFGLQLLILGMEKRLETAAELSDDEELLLKVDIKDFTKVFNSVRKSTEKVALEILDYMTSRPYPDTRRRNNYWSAVDVENFVMGVERFGVGKWAPIRDAYFADGSRTNGDLKDKWKNLVKAASNEQKRDEGIAGVSAELLRRVHAAVSRKGTPLHGNHLGPTVVVSALEVSIRRLAVEQQERVRLFFALEDVARHLQLEKNVDAVALFRGGLERMPQNVLAVEDLERFYPLFRDLEVASNLLKEVIRDSLTNTPYPASLG